LGRHRGNDNRVKNSSTANASSVARDRIDVLARVVARDGLALSLGSLPLAESPSFG
jgi:hypothetical protein